MTFLSTSLFRITILWSHHMISYTTPRPFNSSFTAIVHLKIAFLMRQSDIILLLIRIRHFFKFWDSVWIFIKDIDNLNNNVIHISVELCTLLCINFGHRPLIQMLMYNWVQHLHTSVSGCLKIAFQKSSFFSIVKW